MRRAGTSAARAADSLARSIAAPYHAVTSMAIAVPERLRIVPPDIRTADSTVADEIYAGYFSFDGKTLNAQGASPFLLDAPSAGWRRALAGFSWLRHLRAADRALANANARALVADFLALRKLPADDPAMEPAVTARRMLSFLAQSSVFLEGADPEFYDAFMESLARGARALWRALAGARTRGSDRLFCAIALAEFSACVDTSRKIRLRAARALAVELDRQILSDGGHIGRNPQIVLDLLLDLLPLRQVYAARGVQTPAPVLRAIDRMMPMLRMLQHGDGALALFNGMGVTAQDRVATVLAHDDARGAAPINAPYAGYQRMEARDAVVIVDAGVAPPPEFSRFAHAGCLAFEFSLGVQRLVVNCGAPAAMHEDARESARATAAHSTLVIGDRSSARIAPPHSRKWLAGRVVAGPRNVRVDRQQTEKDVVLALAHDGYARDFGLVHERRLMLARDGSQLIGEDRLVAAEGARPGAVTPEFAVRFHIHPRVRAAPATDGVGVEFLLPSGEIILFEAEGAALAIEESIFLAAPEGPRKCSQIVLTGLATPDARVRWAFTRAGPRASNQVPLDPQL